jgi:hypothetical protein
MSSSIEEESKSSTIPKLTKSNWSSEFKQAFKDYALSKGEAGDIIISGHDVVLREPKRFMTKMIQDPNDATKQIEDPDPRRVMFDETNEVISYTETTKRGIGS